MPQPLKPTKGTLRSALKLGTSPRVIAMGSSFAGIADDVNAIGYNPAGLAYVTDKEATLSYDTWVQDISYDYLAVAWPMDPSIGTLGLSGTYVDGGVFQESTLDANGNPVLGSTFTADDLDLVLSYARKVLPFFSVGINLKYISETIDAQSLSDFAADVSGFWQTPIKGLGVGADFQNLGPNTGYSETFSLPINFRVGVGYKPTDYIAIDCDYDQPIETVGILSIGGEYGYRDFLYVRLGYSFQGAEDYNQTFTDFGPAFAAGLNMGIGIKLYKNYSIDYSYSNYGILGTPNLFALTAKFD